MSRNRRTLPGGEVGQQPENLENKIRTEAFERWVWFARAWRAFLVQLESERKIELLFFVAVPLHKEVLLICARAADEALIVPGAFLDSAADSFRLCRIC